MIFCSLFSFAQELSDAAIGFNADKIRAALKERKLNPSQIEEAVKMQRKSYLLKATQLENIRKEQALKYFPEIKESTQRSTQRSTQSKSAVTDVPTEERNALVALYHATQQRGAWYQKGNWDTNEPVESWQGVTVVNNHVTGLNLGYNNMKGLIPDMSGLKDHLTSIRLSGNYLYGNLENLGKLTALTSIAIDANSFDGTLEPLGNLRNLEHFNAYNNEIKGSIPANFVNLRLLKSFQVTNNKLNGDVSSLGINCPNLLSLSLSNNNFTNTTIPGSFQNLTQLENLDYTNSGLTKGLEILGNLRNLTKLHLDGNKFSGILPQNFQNLNLLNFITLRDNAITDISVLGNINTLEDIWFDGNQIETDLTNFSNLMNLKVLTLSFNKIRGNIPANFTNLQKLNAIGLDYNGLEGIVPKLTFTKGSNGTAFGFSIAGNNFRFIDLKDSYDFYSVLGYNYWYYPQLDTDTIITLSKAQGEKVTLEMCTDNRYLPEDTFQWYKDGREIPEAKSRTFTINSFNSATNKGVYTCLSNNVMVRDLTLSRNKIHLNASNCSEVQGDIITPDHISLRVNQILNFTFQTTTTNLKYDWKIYSLENQLLDQSKEQSFATIIDINNCKIELVVTDVNGCTTSFTKILKLGSGCTISNYHNGYIVPLNYGGTCIGDQVTYSFHKNTPEASLTYKWFLYNKNLELLSSGNEPEFTVSHNSIDNALVKVYVTDQNGCSTRYTQRVTMKVCNSCTNTNAKSEIVKELFIKLLKSLAVKAARGETDTQINGTNPPELIALKEYLKNSTADKIYNFIATRDEEGSLISLQFSFAPEREYDVYYVYSWGMYYDRERDDIPDYYFDLDISQYTGYNDLLISCGAQPTRMATAKSKRAPFENKLECDTGMSIRNVDFCPEKHCTNEPVSLAFETTTPNLNYTWTTTNALGAVVNEVTNTTGLYTFTPELPGTYEIKLTANGTEKCDLVLSKTFTAENCTPPVVVSCTQNNPLTPKIHRLFMDLVNKLASAPDGTNANVYAKNEIAGLIPYTLGTNAKIYKFINNSEYLSFSFSNNSQSDVYLPKSPTGSITGIDLSKYINAQVYTNVTTNYSDGSSNTTNGKVTNINFCPEAECIPITGSITIVKKPTTNPPVDPLPTTVYKYEGLWLADDLVNQPEINSWVDYKDASGAQKRVIVGAITNGCQEITASSIINTNGVGECLPCQELHFKSRNSEICYKVTYLTCMGGIETIFTYEEISFEGKKIISTQEGCDSTDPTNPTNPGETSRMKKNTNSKI